MKAKFTVIVSVAAVLVSLCLAGYINYERMRLESANNSVEVTVDYNDVERMAKMENVKVKDILSAYKKIGVVSAALTEDLAGSFDLNMLSGIDPKKANLYYKSKGLSNEKNNIIRASGLNLIPRVRNILNINEASAQNKIKDLSKYGKVIFAEEEVLGYPNYLKSVAGLMVKNKVQYGFVEFGKQLGDVSLLSYMSGNVAKVHSIPLDEMENMSRVEMKDRYLRAVKERGVRILYVHLLQYPQKGMSLIDTNKDFIAGINKEIKKNRFVLGEASEQKNVRLNLVQKMAMSIGIVGCTVLLINSFIPVSVNIAILLLVIGALFASSKFMLLLAAIVFPSYAVISQFQLNKEAFQGILISKPINKVISVAGITLAGALIISAYLTTKLSLLGVDAFVGIKLAFIFPIIIVAAYFFLRDEESGNIKPNLLIERIKKLLELNISIMHVFLFGIIAAALALLILRSGNFGIPVSGPEKMIRQLLENLLFVRPRTKEFLIGYPALMLASYLYFKGKSEWLWLILSAGVLAPISLLNSFCHIHTPFIISLVRSCIGLILGLFIGLIVNAGFAVTNKFFAKE